MTIGKRLRFEILKRDGFRCRYCGTSCLTTTLEVDHVVPKSKGGSNDPANLITSCFDCNRGKAATGLETSKLEPTRTAASIKEQTRQVRGYIAAVKELEAAKAEIADHLSARWDDLFGVPPLVNMANRFPSLVDRCGMPAVQEAMMVAYNAWVNGRIPKKAIEPYFFGVLRTMRQEGKAT